jgi:hypothetical protein
LLLSNLLDLLDPLYRLDLVTARPAHPPPDCRQTAEAVQRWSSIRKCVARNRVQRTPLGAILERFALACWFLEIAMKSLPLVVAAALLALPVHPAALAPNPGVVFEVELVSKPGATPEMLTTSIEGVNARSRVSGQTDVIYRGATREVLLINHGAKSVTVMDEAAMKQMSAQLGQMMAQMEQMMKNMPEAQRAQMEQVMRGRMGGAASAAPIEIKATAERSTQNGFATTRHEVRRGATKVQDIWVTPWANIDGFKEAQPVMESMADFFKALLDGLRSLAPDAGTETMARVKELGGYPVVTQNYDATGQPTSRISLKAVKRQTVAASVFETPAGYKTQAMPQMGQMPPMGR